MRISIWPSANQPWADVLATAAHAEATGWDGIWVADHFMGNEGSPIPPETPTFEAGTLIAALAASTTRRASARSSTATRTATLRSWPTWRSRPTT